MQRQQCSLARGKTHAFTRRPHRPVVELLEDRTLLTPFIVTNTNDSGTGSLRQAILDANASPPTTGTDLIEFDIPGSGVQTISPASPLPEITVPVTIDGYTQSGASPNTNPAGQGLNTVLSIQLDGANAGLLPFGMLQVAASGSTVEGLNVNNAQGPDIELYGSDDNVITGNFLGTDPTGTAIFSLNTSSGGTLDGIDLKSSAGNTIGGSAPADRNLIAGNAGNGIEIPLYLDTGNAIEGNLIGTDITGTKALGNGVGIDMYGGNGSDSTVGASRARPTSSRATRWESRSRARTPSRAISSAPTRPAR